ncbi:hypothetical protein MUO14_21680 [Halobacillus shinanisalinarum]|uniref:Uncharacterized protein n=1 Tax=Halobacillus shinanisalinarum TaxID=2932258 RepID=A0ABY4GXR4_9BACI|nr:hypothetical protein [Halobacillus shinanisalinarum]UOQ92980.1 hypothetical protein MUO14_21680 [Halobacillus shinanisalinarum]
MSRDNDDRTEPFNNAMEHKQKVEGYPSGAGGRMPVLIRLIGYFMFGGLCLMMIIAVFAAVFFE